MAHRTLRGASNRCCPAVLILCLLGQALWAQSPPSIVGTWKVIAFETRNTDGTVIKEFGEKPLGYFIYDATGHLSIQVMENPAKNDAPTSFGYFGTYTVDSAKGIVIHHIEGALGANTRRLVGKDELRTFRIEGDHLIIEIRQTGPPNGVEYRLREMVRVR